MARSRNPLNADSIALIHAIVERGSFSGAAEGLGVSQPYVSAEVAALEAHIGLSLFTRSKRGASLTAAGQAVLLYSRAVASLDKELAARLSALKGRCVIRIGMSEDFCRTNLPSLLHQFQQNNPEAELRIVSGTYATIMSALDAGEVDFSATRFFSSRSHVETLWESRLLWVGALGLSLADDMPIPLAVPLAPNPGRDAPIEALDKAGVEWRLRFESSGLAGVEAALQTGLGIAAAPPDMLLHGIAELTSPRLPPLPTVRYVLERSATLSPEAQLCYRLVQAAAKQRSDDVQSSSRRENADDRNAAGVSGSKGRDRS